MSEKPREQPGIGDDTDRTVGPQPALQRSSVQDRAIRGASWTMIHTLVSLPVAFIANLLVARALGAEGFGRLALLTSIMTIAGGLVTLGVSSALMQFAAKEHASGNAESVRRLLSLAQGYRLLVIAPVLSAVVFFVTDVSTAFKIAGIALGIWLPSALEGLAVCLQVEQKTAAGAKIAMVANLVLQAGIVPVAFATHSADAVWLMRLALATIGVALAFFVVDPTYRAAVFKPIWPRGFPRGFWAYALPVALSGLVGSLVLSRSEVFLLQWLSTSSAVGLFALAFGLASHVYAPAQALMGPLVPAISSLHRIDPEGVGPALERVLRAGSTIAGLLSVAALPSLAALTTLFYGSEFPIGSLLIFMGIAGAFTVVAGPVSAFVMARLSSKRLLMANLVALAVNAAVALVLIPPLAEWGAGIANVSGSLTSLGILLWTEVRALRISIHSLAKDTLPVVLGTAVTVIVWVATQPWAGAPVLRALVTSVAGVGLLVGGLRVTRTGLTPADRDAVLRTAPPALVRAGARPMRLLARRAG